MSRQTFFNVSSCFPKHRRNICPTPSSSSHSYSSSCWLTPCVNFLLTIPSITRPALAFLLNHVHIIPLFHFSLSAELSRFLVQKKTADTLHFFRLPASHLLIWTECVELLTQCLRSGGDQIVGVKHIQAESLPSSAARKPPPQTESRHFIEHTVAEFNPEVSSINQKMWHVWKTQKAVKQEPRHLLWHRNPEEGAGRGGTWC